MKGSSAKLKLLFHTVVIHQLGLVRYSVHRVGHIESIHWSAFELRVCRSGKVIGHIRVDFVGLSARAQQVRGKNSLFQTVRCLICLSGIQRQVIGVIVGQPASFDSPRFAGRTAIVQIGKVFVGRGVRRLAIATIEVRCHSVSCTFLPSEF